MKRVFSTFICSLLLMSFAGCLTDNGDDDKDSGGSNNNNNNGQTYSVSGHVRDANNAFLEGVTLTLTGTNYQKVATSNNSGVFTFIDVPAGNYTLTPVKNGYTFDPATRTVAVSDDIGNQQFTAALSGGGGGNGGGGGGGEGGNYSISGRAVDSTGNGIPGAYVMLVGNAIETTTDAAGNYIFLNLQNGSYVVSLGHDDFTFDPDYKIVNIVSANVTGIDFTGVTDNGGGNGGDNGGGGTGSFSIFGQVIDNSENALTNVTMTLTGAASMTTMTDVIGMYYFENVGNGNYTITPTKTGYTFTPASIDVTVNGFDTAVALFRGSSSGGSGGSGGGSGGDAGSNTYFPYKIGATWVTLEKTKFQGVEDEAVEYTETITGTETIDGKLYWVSNLSYTDEFGLTEETNYLRVEDGTLYGLDVGLFFGGVSKSANKQTAAKLEKIARAAEDIEVPLFKTTVNAGTQWDIITTSYSEDGGTTSLTIKGKYIGKESVSVQAGSFSNCMKFEISTQMKSSYENYTEVMFVWLAPNVGKAKSTGQMTMDTSFGKMTYTFEEGLISYDIP